MKKTILTIVITIVATSLLWLVVFKASDKGDGSGYFVDYEQSIIGKWTPVEEADFDLEFTKYGMMKWKLGVFEDTFGALNNKNEVINSFSTFLDNLMEVEFPYIVDGRLLSFRDIETDEEVEVEIKIYAEDGVEYLEIYDVTNLAGKYKRILAENELE